MRGQPADTDALLNALRVLRERWWVVALGLILGAAAAYALSAREADVYEAKARVLFGAGQITDQVFDIDRRSSQPERDAATAVVVATSEEVADRVSREIGGDREDLLASLSVEAEENADVLGITAESDDPRRAAAIANAFAAGFISFRRDAERAQLEASIEALRRESAQLPAGSDQARELARQVAQRSACGRRRRAAPRRSGRRCRRPPARRPSRGATR